jgi:phosphate-selective porin
MIKNVMITTLAVLCLLVLPEVIFADEGGKEPVYEKLTEFLKRDYFTMGAVLQVVGDVQPERMLSGNNGFSVANFRLNFRGELDGGFGYWLQASFISSPAILDGSMYYEPNPAARITVGRFKSPFSAEFLIAAPDIDFVNRSQVVSALAPGRQVGVKLSGKTNNKVFSYAAGIFNGNSPSENANDNNDFLYAARATLSTSFSDGDHDRNFEIGANVAQSHDSKYSLHGDRMSLFTGNRMLFGADIRLSVRNWLVSGEAIIADLDPRSGETMKPFGYQMTAGYMVSDKSQLLARWDSFDAEDLHLAGGKTDLVVLGFNHWPTKATELQVNYIIDIDDNALKHNQWLINLQIVF